MGKYINPFTDFGFKKLFGENGSKKSLISFLNDVLPIEDKIADIKFTKNEQLGTSEEKRKVVYDIFCEDTAGNQFIVELQNAKQVYFKDRAVFYSTFPIQSQAEKGEWNFELKKVFCIGLLGFNLHSTPNVKEQIIKSTKYLHEVKLKDQDNQVFYDKLTYIFIEFPKFVKTSEQLTNHLEKWLYFLKNLDCIDQIPDILQEDIFIEAFKTAELAQLNDPQRQEYQNSLKIFRDNINVITTARLEGRLEGEIKGRLEGKKELCKKMLLKNKSIEEIMEFTELSLEEINSINKEKE